MVVKHFGLILTLVCVVAWGSAMVCAQDMDVRVGRTAAGQLKVGGYDFEMVLPLKPTSGIIEGWSGRDPGLANLSVSDPPNDWLTLQSGAQIWLRVVALDPAFRVISPSLAILDEPGEEALLGSHLFDQHPTWHIDSENPDFDPVGCIWEGQFVVRDLGTTLYADSDAFTLKFTNLTASQLATDCNNTDSPDACDIAQGASLDVNKDGIPDECQCTSQDCADGAVCTNDVCTAPGPVCDHDPIEFLLYGDCDLTGAVDVSDILGVLDGFGGVFTACPLERVDLFPCGGDGVADVGDILNVLDAFSGFPACPNPCPPPN
jgi:hypothetical protein